MFHLYVCFLIVDFQSVNVYCIVLYFYADGCKISAVDMKGYTGNDLEGVDANMMKVKRTTLIFLAALVWSIAGLNILIIGLTIYVRYTTFVNFLFSLLIFVVFQRFVFWKLVRKHTDRICSYKENRQFFLKFFDRKGFAIMAVMMGGGIFLRTSKLAPDRFIAVFYTGLGAALLLAGLLFGYHFVKKRGSMAKDSVRKPSIPENAIPKNATPENSIPKNYIP